MKNKFKATGAVIMPSESKVEFVKLTTVEVEQGRYEDLLAQEERLRLLERAIREKGAYESIGEIKKIFGLEKGEQNV